MHSLPDPVWPVIVLAAISAVDGALCVKPVGFIAACFEAVQWPRRLWWMMPAIKFAAAAGLVAGVWIPYLGMTTSLALVLYFLVAIAAHIRARDFGRNLFLNATGMLLVCIAVSVFCFFV
jgi:hypothetical protein